jgi:hypothetical protein
MAVVDSLEVEIQAKAKQALQAQPNDLTFYAQN